MKGKQMSDANYKPGGNPDQLSELDRMLDATLAKFGAVEPPLRLEERILAHLRAEPLQSSRHGWLQWGLVGAVALIAMVAVLAWRSTRVSNPPIANHPPATILQPASQEAKPAPHTTDEVAAAKPASMPKPVAHRAPALTAAVAYPKLDQFPSPQPLTEEEIALAHYVKNFPKEARLVAQAQEEFELEAQKEMNDAGSESWPSGSTQHER
jgi:hypothetical protein